MASIRTQIYLTAEQRAAIDARMKRDGESLAWIVREALDQYLGPQPQDLKSVLDRTFGAIPDLEVPPRSEGDRYSVDLERLPRRSAQQAQSMHRPKVKARKR